MGSQPGASLTLAHQRDVEFALSALPRGQPEQTLSDTTFSNLYLFRRVHDYRYLPGLLPCISGRSYDGVAHLLPLFDLAKAPLAELRILLRHFSDESHFFFPLSSEQVQDLNPEIFEWTASRDDADYVYPAEQFWGYRGSVLHKKRNLVSQLMASHAVSAQPYEEVYFEDARSVLKNWMTAKGKAAGEADELACLEALEQAQTLGLQGFLYRVDGEVAGFVLAQTLASGVWVMRFAKGLDHIKGLYQHMFQHFCQARPEVQWLNFEQDMGIANLRKTKLSYQPALLLPKYRVRLRVSHFAQDAALA